MLSAIIITEPKLGQLLHSEDFQHVTGYKKLTHRQAMKMSGDRAGPVLFKPHLDSAALAWTTDSLGYRRLALSGLGLFEFLLTVQVPLTVILQGKHQGALGRLYDPESTEHRDACDFLTTLAHKAAASRFAGVIGVARESIPGDPHLAYLQIGEVLSDMLSSEEH